MHAVQFSRVISTDALSLVEPILNPQRISFVIEQWRYHANAADQSVFLKPIEPLDGMEKQLWKN
jgi:hypothetical protein